MANPEHLEILKFGVDSWNKERERGLHKVDLIRAELAGLNLGKYNLSYADLRGANLTSANLNNADLRSTDLRDANLSWSNLSEANLRYANLEGANLMSADLAGSSLIGAKVNHAIISGSYVYGINVWDLDGEFGEQRDLIITPLYNFSLLNKTLPITVDNIKVAQFIYLILNNKEIRDVINTLTSKSVLILGRFADDHRKAVLNRLRNELRGYNLLPIVFDFDRPIDRNITETVKTLAGISYFVIADVTSPKSAPLELQAIIPDYQIPVVPIIQDSELPFSMINDLKTQHSGLLDPLTYDTEETLIKVLKSAIIDPAIEKHNELRLIKAQKPRIRSARDFLDKEME
jgi:hypothetical protein